MNEKPDIPNKQIAEMNKQIAELNKQIAALQINTLKMLRETLEINRLLIERLLEHCSIQALQNDTNDYSKNH